MHKLAISYNEINIYNMPVQMKEQLILRPIESRKDSFTDFELRFNVLRQILSPFTGSSVLFATTESGFEVAIKISVREGGTEREWLGLNKVYTAGVPVPEPLVLARDEEWNLMLILEKIEGEKLLYNPKSELRYQLGQIVRKMHKRVPIDNEEWAKGGKSDFTYYDRHLFYWLGSPIKELAANSRTQVLLVGFADAMKNYCRGVMPVFTHHDIHDGQVFVRENGELTLFDFENWQEEGWLSELAHYLFHSIRTERAASGFREFVKGYLKASAFTENERSALIFQLLFTSARAVDYFSRYKQSYLKTALNNHRKVLGYIDQERLWKEI